MARLSHANQSRFPLPRFDSRRTHRARSNTVHGSGKTERSAARPRHSGVDQLLFQIPNDRAWPLSRARSIHPIDEAEEHSASSARRRVDYAPGAGVLRLRITPCPSVCFVVEIFLTTEDTAGHGGNKL